VTALRCLGGPGAVPSRAEARLDVRVPPGVAQARVQSLVRRGLAGGVRPPLRVEIRVAGATPGLCAELPPAVLAAVRTACRDGYGVEPRTDSSGGSIPALAVLARQFPAPPVLLGTGPADDHAHGPDEYLHVGDWTKAVLTSVSLVAALLGAEQWPGRVIVTGGVTRLTHEERLLRHGLSVASTGRGTRGSPTQRT
jgi:acetylornithine deacetylase/succinyl-diaminopimelate desuccinylase-like protein